MSETDEERRRRTARAREKMLRNAERRAADKLRARGWECTPPEELEKAS